MSGHTPGAWIWQPAISSAGGYVIRSQSCGYAPLATVRGDKRSTLADARANAALIAAAPDLLEALRVLLDLCDDEAAARKARFAISIAEGRRP